MRVIYSGLNEIYDGVRAAACARQTCAVLVIVAYEVDAIASTKMLTQMLRNDNVAYTLIPVSDPSQLDKVTISSDIKCVFMINCGAVCFLNAN